MKTLIKLTLFAFTLFLFSCEKDEDPIPQNSDLSIDSFFNSRNVNSESFQFNAATGGSFITSKGSEISVPANVFLDQDGNLVTGNIDFKVKEVFSTSDIIFSGIFPISGDEVINSGGEIFLEASQNGEILELQDWNFVNAEIPAQAEDQNMELFFGGGDENDDDLNWMPLDSINDIINEGDSLWNASGFSFNSADDSYNLTLDSLGWANIDAFLSNVSYFDCTFNLNGVSGLNNSNTTAFAVFVGENAVWPVGVNSWGSISNNVITDSHLADVDLNLLVISVVDGDLYYGLLNITPAPNSTYDIDMVLTTESELDALINGLP